MKSRPWIVGALLALAASGSSAAVITGSVTSVGNRPVEHARIEVSGQPVTGFSNRDGRFELDDVDTPLTLEITHPRFELETVRVQEADNEVGIVLTPKQAVFETIAVSANRGSENFAPVSIASSVIEPLEASAPVSSVTELLAETAGVVENGQGGLFQTYSIRGFSRQRVATLVAGMRIVSERRAGVSASFVDPLLLGSVDVVRGPSSTYYGSGALGGVVQLFPRRFDGLTIDSGIESQGRESHLLLAGGAGSTSWGLALRDAGRPKTPTGDELNSGFQQLSMSLARRWERGGLGFDVSLVGSSGRDIGKANVDFPTRVTTYPDEQHVIVRLGIEKPQVWSFEFALHPNRLGTRVEEPSRQRSQLDNEAVDISLSFQRRFSGTKLGSSRIGVDYFARRGVTAREEVFDVTSIEPRLDLVGETLSDGREDELGIFGSWEWNRGPAVVVAGGRLAVQRQDNQGSESVEDGAATAFLGAVVPAGGGLEVVANIGTGLRFPSLSERFFSGTTGRGTVVGREGLEPERSLTLDAGLRFYGERLFITGTVFGSRIDDYIERVEIEPNRLTFVNLGSGRIRGVELEGLLQLDAEWSLELGGHVIEGRDAEDQPLADMPPDRLYAGTKFARGRWTWRLRGERRDAKKDPGSGEKPIPAADLVAFKWVYELRPGLSLGLSLRNVLDEEYFNSADRKVPLAPGRSVSVSMRWSRAAERIP